MGLGGTTLELVDKAMQQVLGSEPKRQKPVYQLQRKLGQRARVQWDSRTMVSLRMAQYFGLYSMTRWV